MRLIIKDTKEDVAMWIANYVRKCINTFKPSAEKPFVLGLPTGSSPLPTYQDLIKFHREGSLRYL
jgi:glucosamine-6-phosphate deaminase